MGLKRAYTLWAPVYDWVIASATRESRRRSLAALGDVTGRTILLAGIGTGLDVPLLPQGARYIGLDRTPAMLRRAQRMAEQTGRVVSLQIGDAMRLPYRDAVFDAVILHLIVAVVPDPRAALAEAARVVKRGGRLLIFDKFLRAGQSAPLRRAISPWLGLVATRTDVVFEELLAATPGLKVVRDEPDLAGGWFRRIVLERSP
ncbi:MAG: methyltransferase domain-containing protein [Nitrospirae bacterium]|nr:methyltransferase domain-containing protein [Nitrospirota bacterium]